MTLLRPTLQGRAGFNPNGYGPGVNAPFGKSAGYFNNTRTHHGQDYFWLGAASALKLGISTDKSKGVYACIAGPVYRVDNAALGLGLYQQIDSTTRVYYWHLSQRVANGTFKTADRIGGMGHTGTAAGSSDHLHLEVRKAPYGFGDRIDPDPFLTALTEEQKARYRRIAAFLNPHAVNVGLPKTTTVYDGNPGENYWKLVQAVGKAWGFYSGLVDGDPASLTYAADEQLWVNYVNKPNPAPAPKPEPAPKPVPAPAPEPTPTPEPAPVPVNDPEPEQPAEEQEAPVTPTPDPDVDDIVSQPIPDEPEGQPEPDPQHAARREALVRRIFTAIADVIRGRRTVGELAIATLRTVVPFVYSWVLVWATTNVSWLDWLAYVPADIAVEVQSAAVIALGTGIYALLRKLAQRWPNLERFLGSAKTPTYSAS